MRTIIYDEYDLGNTKPDKIFLREFIASQAAKEGYTLEQILSHDRDKELVVVRHGIARALRDRGLSFAQIGRIMNRDHSSIIYAVRA